ncbi:acyltransferase [Sorangium sp. So ce117]|uniref:acyltransferase n=1 Tax=Sorangium sp. So ce117 TaxID=3133277 RepID=UPI003F64622C
MKNLARFLASSDHDVARALRHVRRQVRSFTLPAPRPLVVPMRIAFEAAREVYYFGARVLVCEPHFKSHCAQYGKGVRTGTFIHFITGRGDIILGDNVVLDGKTDFIFAARFCDRPTLRIGDNTGIGHGCRIVVGKSVTIGKHCMIAAGVFILDSSGHPSDPEARRRGLPPSDAEVRPVVIEDNVWLGTRSTIFPGVTVGEGSVVSAGSIVMADVPPYTVVAGNPARRVASLRTTEPPPPIGPATDRADASARRHGADDATRRSGSDSAS